MSCLWGMINNLSYISHFKEARNPKIEIKVWNVSNIFHLCQLGIMCSSLLACTNSSLLQMFWLIFKCYFIYKQLIVKVSFRNWIDIFNKYFWVKLFLNWVSQKGNLPNFQEPVGWDGKTLHTPPPKIPFASVRFSPESILTVYESF